MGLFDRFKKKPLHSTAVINFEELLKKSATEPAFRAEFYARLLAEDIYVITANTDGREGSYTVEKDTVINLATFEDGKIPIFTSIERIFDKNIIKDEVRYMKMKCANLFSFAKGVTFILNPYSDYGKELLPEEVDAITNGTILTKKMRQMTIEKDTKIMIGQPAIYPTELVNSLTRLFMERPAVGAAYLGWIHDPASGQEPHYIFGIETDDYNSIIAEIGPVVDAYLIGTFADFIQIKKGEGLSDYFFRQTTPFYLNGKANLTRVP